MRRPQRRAFLTNASCRLRVFFLESRDFPDHAGDLHRQQRGPRPVPRPEQADQAPSRGPSHAVACDASRHAPRVPPHRHPTRKGTIRAFPCPWSAELARSTDRPRSLPSHHEPTQLDKDAMLKNNVDVLEHAQANRAEVITTDRTPLSRSAGARFFLMSRRRPSLAPVSNVFLRGGIRPTVELIERLESAAYSLDGNLRDCRPAGPSTLTVTGMSVLRRCTPTV